LALTALLGCGAREEPAAPGPGTTPLAEFAAQNEASLRIGYFHGGRNLLLYRAMDEGTYQRRGVDVSFWSTLDDRGDTFYRIPERILDLEAIRSERDGARYFGHTTGRQISVELERGRLHCGMIGESTFLEAVDKARPWHAVAKLGQDRPDAPAKVVIVRPGLQIRGPEDLRGLRVGTRRSGLYDRTMLRAWLLHSGVDPADVRIQDDIPHEDLIGMIERQELDLAFVHVRRASRAVDRFGWQVLPWFEFTFADPTLSHSLLVCRDDAIASRRAQIVAFLEAYKLRVDHENGLSDAERLAHEGDKAYGMALDDLEGFDLPTYSGQPLVDPTLLETMQALLYGQGFLPQRRPVAPFVDNSLMEEALAAVDAEQAAAQP
jgi:ABC-type nitrate/sulfonate/bicarbonate transport system substrate-binding protein